MILYLGLGENKNSKPLLEISERDRLNGLTSERNTANNVTLTTTAFVIDKNFFITFKFLII
jgi:hypothetical protein